jgi:hypothetical protein
MRNKYALTGLFVPVVNDIEDDGAESCDRGRRRHPCNCELLPVAQGQAPAQEK